MAAISTISLSGMQVAQTQLDVAAGNIANAQTVDYQRRTVVQTSLPNGGVTATVAQNAAVGNTTGTATDASLATDVVSELQAKNAFIANLAVFKTANKMSGALLDVKG